MPVIAIDLGGTKLATAVFSEEGNILYEEKVALQNGTGSEVGALIAQRTKNILTTQKEHSFTSIGVSVPGISYQEKGTVWAPNIAGWEDYPLRNEISAVAHNIPVMIDSDRACYILGEAWQGNARGCSDAVFLAVGTGIGAGILANGSVLRGAHDIAGAIGWMALEKPYHEKFRSCGCFESRASGEGIAKLARELLNETKDYNGILKEFEPAKINAYDIFRAHDQNDAVAKKVIKQCIELWGMGVANLVSLFNPQKIIFGGGVFGPAIKFIPDIYKEAAKWAQPVSMKQVVLEPSALGYRAGLYGAAWLALQKQKAT